MSLACATCPVREQAACSVLNDNEREQLARSGRTRKLKRGEVLFAAGDDAQTCATLQTGALKISQTDANGEEHILALVHPAGFVGELFQPFMQSDVIALTDCELCLFSGTSIDQTIGQHPELAKALLRRSQEDLHASRALLALAGNHSAAHKVGGLLMAFAHAASDSPCHPVSSFQLPLNRGEIGNMLGLAIETVSRQLSRFEQEGAIRRTGQRGIEILDPALLAPAA
ncbi:Crp/Fnr family transcriptional regulator [Erythrobacter sp. W53]|uniref:Crp/Fnr family transcriptional regulator n=1 Tax=Erythrobacter sp. W53 TaxID=3425947 RepID=UPI003D7698AB